MLLRAFRVTTEAPPQDEEAKMMAKSSKAKAWSSVKAMLVRKGSEGEVEGVEEGGDGQLANEMVAALD